MKKLADGLGLGFQRASLALPGSAFDPNRDHGLIVERFLSRRVFGHSFEDQLHDLVGRSIRVRRNNFADPLAAEEFFRFIAGIQDAVAEEYEHVSGFSSETELVIVSLIEQSQGQAGGFDDLNRPIVVVNWARQSGVGYLQSTISVVPYGVDQRHKLAVDTTFAQRKVDRGQHFCRPGLDGRMGTQNSADQCSLNRRRSTFAADVANHYGRARHGIADEIVKVAPNRARWNELRGYIKMRELGQRRW